MSSRQVQSTDAERVFDPDSILFHGSGVLVVNKPAGVPVHRGTGHDTGLAERIEGWISLHPKALDTAPGKRVRPAHRLDLEASGVLILALTGAAARRIQRAFSEQAVEKRYLAVVSGPVPEMGHIEGPVRSRIRGVYHHSKAELTFQRLRGDERLSLVDIRPSGGKTHQIRELFARVGRPLAGDLRYGRPTPSRQFLHRFGVPCFLLHALEVTLPAGVLAAPRTFRAPLPSTFARVIEAKGWEPLEEA